MPAPSAALPNRKLAAAVHASVRQIVMEGSPDRSLGQDQLVLRRQPQAIIVLAMRDDDLALGREQFAAVDPVAADRKRSRSGSGAGLCPGVVSRCRGHVVCGAPKILSDAPCLYSCDVPQSNCGNLQLI